MSINPALLIERAGETVRSGLGIGEMIGIVIVAAIIVLALDCFDDSLGG